MPPKKKVAGDAGKGEKIFKNLCAVCHSFSVSSSSLTCVCRPTELAPTSQVQSVEVLLQRKVSAIRKLPYILNFLGLLS